MKKTRWGDYETTVKFAVWSNFTVHVVFTDNIARSRTGRYETAGAAADPDTAALFTRGAGGYGHLFFQSDACARIIAHECWHALWWMFQWAGATTWDNETTAYHIGYLVGKVSEFQAKVLGVKSSSKKRSS